MTVISSRALAFAIAAAVALSSACGEAPTTPYPSGEGEPTFAKGGNGGSGGGSGDPEVDAVDPDTVSQGQTIDVIVLGDNFEPGSVVDWLIGGTPSLDVRTNNTTFLNKKRLRANITVDPDAATVLYDARVTTPPGRRGIGSEALEVLVGETPVTTTIDDTQDVTSDGAGPYLHDVDDTRSVFLDRGDYALNTAPLNSQSPVRNARVRVFRPGQTGPAHDQIAVVQMSTKIVSPDDAILRDMPVGGPPQPTTFGMNWVDDSGTQNFLRAGNACEDNATPIPSKRASVERLDDVTWVVTSSGGVWCQRQKKGRRIMTVEPDAIASVRLTLVVQEN